MAPSGRAPPPSRTLRGVHGSSLLHTSCPSRHSAGSRGSPARGPVGGRAERGPSMQAPGHRHLHPHKTLPPPQNPAGRTPRTQTLKQQKLEGQRPLPARRRTDGCESEGDASGRVQGRPGTSPLGSQENMVRRVRRPFFLAPSAPRQRPRLGSPNRDPQRPQSTSGQNHSPVWGERRRNGQKHVLLGRLGGLSQ